MPAFCFKDETVTITPGQRWSAPAGNEAYHDTAADNLRAIVAEIQSGRPWREAVDTRFAQSHPWLHQIVTSPSRDLFFRQHPPRPNDEILDVGSGWGQIALPLARKGHRVTALEPTPERLAFIEAAATQERLMDRMSFIQAGFHEISFTSRFDLISCIGVLEWTPRFQPGEPRAVQLAFLCGMREALRPGGRCYVGIENRLGLKYLMGSRDDHTARSHISVFDADLAAAKHLATTGQPLRVFTHTQAEYHQLFREAGFSRMESYGAFPDYKLPQLILPVDTPDQANHELLNAEIPPEHDGADGHVLPNQEEYRSHYRSLAGLGIAHHFCPSFFFVLQ